jgi:hypothetical protein
MYSFSTRFELVFPGVLPDWPSRKPSQRARVESLPFVAAKSFEIS